MFGRANNSTKIKEQEEMKALQHNEMFKEARLGDFKFKVTVFVALFRGSFSTISISLYPSFNQGKWLRAFSKETLSKCAFRGNQGCRIFYVHLAGRVILFFLFSGKAKSLV